MQGTDSNQTNIHTEGESLESATLVGQVRESHTGEPESWRVSQSLQANDNAHNQDTRHTVNWSEIGKIQKDLPSLSTASNRNHYNTITNNSSIDWAQTSKYQTRTQFEFEHIESPEKSYLNNSVLQLRHSLAFVPYARERNNYGSLLGEKTSSVLQDATWRSLDMSLQDKLALQASKNRLNPLKLTTDKNLMKIKTNS